MSLVDIPESYSLEYALRARKERLARMNAAPRRPMPVPVSQIILTDVDFGTDRNRELLEANRIRADLCMVEYQRKQLQQWCRKEIRRCRKGIKATVRLQHGRRISDDAPEQAKAIIAEVLRKYGITQAELLARPTGVYKFIPGVFKPMQEVAWRLYNETNPQLPLKQLASILGGRNHTTVLHSIRSHQYQLDNAHTAKPTLPKCATCGKEWVPDKLIRKYCSRACAGAHGGNRGGGRKPKCEVV